MSSKAKGKATGSEGEDREYWAFFDELGIDPNRVPYPGNPTDFARRLLSHWAVAPLQVFAQTSNTVDPRTA